jgi:GT2 family glycosyltransferase
VIQNAVEPSIEDSSLSTLAANSIGVVVIGRNEGERLRRCLDSVIPSSRRVVYVDSGSNDGSVTMARGKGVDVVDLDMSIPFCAARARNEGFQRLIQIAPELKLIQFIDGDCELNADWLPVAAATLQARPQLAIVAGWLRERSPEVSIYNRLGDVQWNVAGVGLGEVEVDSVGGIFVIRRDAFESVGGFDNTVAAGEEPELCKRLSQKGWRFVRLDRDMALHDLAMTRFSQWWKRQIRSGYGSMDVAVRFALPKFKRNNLRVMAWSGWLLAVLALGIVAAVMAPVPWPATVAWLALVGLWPLQTARITWQLRRKGQPWSLSMAYAFFLMTSFWPQMIGQLMYWNDRRHKRSFRLVEYKATANGPGARQSR